MNKRLQLLTFTALSAALIAAMTLFAHIPFPMTNDGYVHLGDGMVFLAACLLPAPYAAAAAAIGCGLADALPGYFVWIPATIVLKACMALLFSSKQKKILCARNFFVLLPACLINGVGYYLYEGFVFSQWGALVSVFGNLIQAGAGIAVFILIGAAMDRLKIKNKLLFNA